MSADILDDSDRRLSLKKMCDSFVTDHYLSDGDYFEFQLA